MTRGFFSWHPLVSFLYFTLVIGFSMVLNHTEMITNCEDF